MFRIGKQRNAEGRIPTSDEVYLLTLTVGDSHGTVCVMGMCESRVVSSGQRYIGKVHCSFINGTKV
jgi:hypothetical protein